MMKTSILLLNYNGKRFNKKCIDSILSQTYKDFEIIFIDNKSTDGSLEEVINLYDKEIKKGTIKIVKNDENYFFAGGNNIGTKYANGSDYIRLLNNDTEIDKDCLLELIKGIEGDKSLGAVSSLILDRGKEEQIKAMTEKGMVRIMNVFGLQAWEKANIKDDILYTNFLCGCSFLYKKSLVEEPFFDFYKFYAEDMQLSWELILKGYKLGICKKSVVHHFGSGTMNMRPSYVKIFYETRNLLINYSAFFGFKTKFKLFPLFLIFHLLQIVSIPKNSFYVLKAKINSFFRLAKNKELVHKVRDRVNNGRVLSEKEFLKTMSRKMASDDFNSGKTKLLMIDFLNRCSKLYLRLINGSSH